MLRRLARICPAYYLIILVFWSTSYLTHYLDWFSVPKRDIADLILHLSFLNFFDYRHINTTLYVEWSVAIEMFAYLFLPILFFALDKRSFWVGVPLIVLSFMLSTNAQETFFTIYPDPAWSWNYSLEKFAYCFVCGAFLFSVMKDREVYIKPIVADILLMVWIYVLHSAVILRWHNVFLRDIDIMTIWVMGAIWLLPHSKWVKEAVFENRFAMFMGEVSFSYYLLHVPINTFVRGLDFHVHNTVIVVSTLIVTAIASYFTAIWIEQPAVNWMNNRLSHE